MAILADPIVRVRLKEFRATLDALLDGKYMTDGDRIAHVRELCVLSRDTKLDLGPALYADSDQLHEVASCFERAVNDIRGLWAEREVPEDIEKYCQNIEIRSRRCRGEE